MFKQPPKKTGLIIPFYVKKDKKQNKIEELTKVSKATLESIKLKTKFCKCGCGCKIKDSATWVRGHHITLPWKNGTIPVLTIQQVHAKQKFLRERAFTGPELRNARENAGYTAKEICIKLNITTKKLIRCETNKRCWDKKTEEKLLEMFPELRKQ